MSRIDTENRRPSADMNVPPLAAPRLPNTSGSEWLTPRPRSGEPTAIVADRHPLVLEGLSQVLTRSGITVTERCSTGAALLQCILALQPSIALLDLHIGDPDGFAVLKEIKSRGVPTAVVVVSGTLKDHEVLESVQLGVRGLVTKDAPLDRVAECVCTVLAGGTCLDQRVVGRAVAALLVREAALREVAQLLTRRESQVLRLVVEGLRTHDMAARLFVSEGTLKVHLHHIYQKLGVLGRAELVAYARTRGLA
jgi:DNA-binding NarL/FixJ family response regulator